MASIPPAAPADASNAPLDEHDALPPGTRFGELEILRVLGIGGFGIVYLAQDHALERHVALKEYMPGSLAGRGKGQMVSLRSGAHTETYALGLRSFVNEARLLARFNHPSLVKVYRFWEENGTAYMVMPYLQGLTLRDVRRSMSEPPAEAWIRSVVDPLLDALDLLHREGVYHRDIAPDNVLLPPNELPVLLDFGAARRAIGDHTQTFTAILKPNYAPIEQYAESVQLRQGPWTDLYALGAVVYYLLKGTPPPPATARAVQDDVQLLLPDENAGVTSHFLAAFEWALSVRPAERPQNIAALREVMDGRAAVPPRGRTGTTGPNRTVFHAPLPESSGFAPTMPADHPSAHTLAYEATRPMTTGPHRTAPGLPVGFGRPVDPGQGDVPQTAPHSTPEPTPRTAPPAARTRPDVTVMPAMTTLEAPHPAARRPWLVAVVAGLVGVIGASAVAAWMAGQRPGPSETASAAVAASQPAEAAPAPAPGVVSNVSTLTPTTAAPALDKPSTPVTDSTAAARPTSAANPAQKPALPSANTRPTAAGTSAPPSAAVATMDASSPRVRLKERLRDLQGGPGAAREDARTGEGVTAASPTQDSSRADAAPGRQGRTPALLDGPASPRQACGSRVFLALAACMEAQCERQRFKSHPQCDKVREMVERRRRTDGG